MFKLKQPKLTKLLLTLGRLLEKFTLYFDPLYFYSYEAKIIQVNLVLN